MNKNNALPQDLSILKHKLDSYYHAHNTVHELNPANPDPLFIARQFHKHNYNAEIALICALLSYGNARAIVKVLSKLDFTLLEKLVFEGQKSRAIYDALLYAKYFPHYRFQSPQDIAVLFQIIATLIMQGGIKTCFLKAYHDTPNNFISSWNQSQNPNHARIIYAIYSCIDTLYTLCPNPPTQGLGFLLGKSYTLYINKYAKMPSHVGALKRWNMYLRWLVRSDCLDMGLWSEIACADLILPLDTHTFTLCRKLNILTRKSYDLQSALQATDTLALLLPHDPIAYDFALYRLGQSGKI